MYIAQQWFAPATGLHMVDLALQMHITADQ